MKKAWYLLKLDTGSEQTVYISHNHKKNFKKMIQTEERARIVQFSKLKVVTPKPTEYLDCVAQVHLNRHKEMRVPEGMKDSMQRFIDRFRNTQHVQIRYGLYDLSGKGTGTLMATNLHPIDRSKRGI